MVNGKVVKLEQFSSLKSTLTAASTGKFRKTSADEDGAANEGSSIFSNLRGKKGNKVEKAIKAALGSSDPDQQS